MGYEYKVSDVYDFAAAHGYETRTKGDEIEFICKEETAPKVIHDILYRELKERLERGDFG